MYKISYKLTNFLEWFIAPIFLHKIWRSGIDTQPTEKINVNNAKSINPPHKKHYFSHFYSNIHPIREHWPYFWWTSYAWIRLFNIVLYLQHSRFTTVLYQWCSIFKRETAKASHCVKHPSFTRSIQHWIGCLKDADLKR